MKKLILFILVIPLLIFAQEGWVRWYGNEEEDVGYSICEAHENGWLITGFTYTYEDLWIVRLDTFGDTLWTRQYGGGYRQLGMCIHPMRDGNYIISGEDAYKIWLLMINEYGDTLWTRVITIEDFEIKEGGGKWLEITNDGGFIITGYGERGPHRAFLIKTDSLGNMEWSHIFVEYGSSEGLCVQQTDDGGYVVSGYANPESPQSQYGYICLIKTDAQGNPLWKNIYSKGCGNCLRQSEDGGYIIASNAGLIKTDSEGNPHWTKTGEYYSIQHTNDGGYIASGVDLYRGLFLQRLDENGQELWHRNYRSVGTSKWFKTFPVVETDDGGFITVGARNDMYVIKTDSLGQVPLEVSPRLIHSPKEGYALYRVTPLAIFGNFGMPDTAESFYYHCEIIDQNDSSVIYHDSIFADQSIAPWEERSVEFSEWEAQSISDFTCTFYTKGAGKCQPMSVNFRWTGIDEQPTAIHQPTFEVLTAVGAQIQCSFSPSAQRTQISVFDALGRKVDEIIVPQQGGVVSWPVTPDAFSPGVYFIKSVEARGEAHKVVLVY